MYIADLHIHSRYSRATSKDGDLPHLDLWARRKGIDLLGTGDLTHPAWRAEMKDQLIPAGEGVYTLREDLRLAGLAPGRAPRFVITGEISSIYKRGGKTRKVHNLILLPSLEAADALSAKLEAIGNIHSDGRPILGLDSRDLLELTLESCPDAEFVPAHIWTPHFAMFGAFSGFDTIQECFGDMAPYIHGVETGLSSDPPMNWRVSALDKMTLLSNSDAHSPAKLGREANLIDSGRTYPELVRAIRTGEGFEGTIEFFPEEGKYHLDGHRSCGVCLTPLETVQRDGLCPVCGKKLTIGVEHRVEELADRPVGYRPAGAKPFESLAPLPEVIAASTGTSPAAKKTQALYEEMLQALGPEFAILREVPTEDIAKTAGACVAEGIRRLRAGKVERRPGFDGEYGTITLLTPSEIQQMSGQVSLFAAGGLQPAPSPQVLHPQRKAAAAPPLPKNTEELNEQQREAVVAKEAAVAVIAGPGTGKTKTLVARIAHLVEVCGAKPEEITAVTFTNQAATEMRQRLEKRLGGKRAVAKMTIGTFHAVCLRLLGDVQLLGSAEAAREAGALLREYRCSLSPTTFLQAVSKVKNGSSCAAAGVEEEWYNAYQTRLKQLGVLDLDDLLLHALERDTAGQRRFTHLLVDEFQDINDVQYRLVKKWSSGKESLLVIGDPDQAIYGFRGASGHCFQRLEKDLPALRQIRLTENYRSTPEILRAAQPVIQKNPGGARGLSPNRASGAAVRLIQGESDLAEGIFIAKEIGRMAGGVDMLEADRGQYRGPVRAFSDIAVLCRTHRQLQLVEKCLAHDDIPCVVAGRQDFWEKKEVQGTMAFFRSLTCPQDAQAFETALALLWNCPADLIPKARGVYCQPQASAEKALGILSAEPFLKKWAEGVELFLPLVEKESPWKLMDLWQEWAGVQLQLLRNTAVFYPTFHALWEAALLGQEGDLRRASDSRWQSGAVRLMTFHGAKGLEFPVVFLAGVNAGVLPMESSSRPADVEEERRLFYVGMTRAQEELILTTSAEGSPFLADLPPSVRRERARRFSAPAAEQMSWF